jgi:CRP/FNR family transcriptional regulator/CRP/FNR family cyclic AMP-dependent transcriptional regulator
MQDPLKNIPLFSTLSREQRGLIQSGCRTLSVSKDTVILHQKEHSDDLRVVLSGRVKVSLLSEDGREMVLDLLKDGDFFGELSLLDQEPRSATVTALDDSKILTLSREAFLNAIKGNPEIMLNILSVVVKRLRKADERIETLTFLDVKGRVAKMLTDLAHDKGEKQPDGGFKLQAPTHQWIASQIGASREAVTKAMKTLISEGLVTMQGREMLATPRLFKLS